MSGSEQKAAVGFVFAYVRKQVRDWEDVGKVQDLHAQSILVRMVATAFRLKLLEVKPAITTYRAHAFVDGVQFARALEAARKAEAALIVGDCFGSLRTVGLEDAMRSIRILDAIDLPLVNAADGRVWASYSATEKQTLYSAVATRLTIKSNTIKRGLPGKRDVEASGLRARQKRGARTVAANADRRATMLAGTIEEILKDAGDAGVSASSIAAQLNARGIKSARRMAWTATTVQRLRRRIEGLEAKKASSD